MCGKASAQVKKVLENRSSWKKYLQWEKVVTAWITNKTWKMRKYSHLHILKCALLDWNILGYYFGFYSSQQAQNEEKRDLFPTSNR